MIKVNRTAKPAILAQKEAEWSTALQQAKTKSEKDKAIERYKHKQIRVALEAMFHSKCAYCESKIAHVSFAHIEHYRPKSRFPNRTFDWYNLLLACGRCNQSPNKGDRFPGAPEGGPLINPCTENPDDHLTFHFDPHLGIASVYGKTTRGDTTERLLGLNRPDLRKQRSKWVKVLAYLKARAQSDPVAAQLFQEAVQDSAEYAAFARSL